MIADTVALPVSGPEGAYRVRRSATSVEAAEATVSRPTAAQPAPAATVAATIPPLGSVSLACIRRLLVAASASVVLSSPHRDGALHHLEVVLAVEDVEAGLGRRGEADGGGGVDRQVPGHLGRLEGQVVLHVVGVGDLEGDLLPGRDQHVLGVPDEVQGRLGQL